MADYRSQITDHKKAPGKTETTEKVPFCHPERQRRIFKLLKALDSSTAFQNDKQKSVVFQQSRENPGAFLNGDNAGLSMHMSNGKPIF